MTDARGHLDLDALADVLAGEREDPHLRSCAPCSARLAELAAADVSVSGALAALPPPALPAGLSGRLARALQEERRREVAAVRPLRRRAPRWLGQAAAAAVLVLGGALGVSLLDLPDQSSDDAASTAGGGGQEAAPAQPESAASLAVPGSTGTDWADEASRTAALPRLLSTADADDAARGSAAVPATDPALDRLRDPAELAACLANLPGGDQDVLALDYAQYAGTPAVAVVQPADPGFVRVEVVGSDCSARDPDLLSGAVLPRP